jgi:DNA-binding protein H-NS
MGEIKMATLESIQVKIRKLEQQAEALIAKQASGVVEKIRDLMAKHGLTIADIEAHVGSKQLAKKTSAIPVGKEGTAAAKYRDPKSGATWSGHGRAPRWIAATKNRDKFLVDGSMATVKGASVSKAKIGGNYARGPQPAMYQDPKSSATLSGRGRAPFWIAEAKDRSKFLIADGVEANFAATASAAGVASKAKTVDRKTSNAVGETAGKGQPKGPQPALYRDPKSGKTWSGRGPAPAWLTGAKDRSKFLIAEEGTATVDAKTSKPKTAVKKPLTATAVARPLKVRKVSVAKNKGTGEKSLAARKAVVGKRAGATNALAASKTVASEKKPASLRKRPMVKKVAIKKSVADKAVLTSAEPTATLDPSTEVSA